MMTPLTAITDRMHTMRPMSGNTLAILDLISTGDYEVKKLAALVKLDMSLTTRCLQVVNSAAFGLRHPVSGIDRAVSYLGSRAIVTLALSDSLGTVYSAPLDGYGGGAGSLWKHSLRSAIAARHLASALSIDESADLAYTAALLHDLGKAVLNEFFPAEGPRTVERFEIGDKNDFLAAETALFDVDHAAIGAALAEQWGLPEPLRHAIRFHHHPGEAPEAFQPLCLLVHLGDLLAMLGGSGTGGDTLGYRVDPLVERRVKLEWKMLARLLLDIDREFGDSTTVLAAKAGGGND